MSWGIELWDQFENISTHTQKGIDFTEKFSHFVKERSAIENEYASKLKRLVKSYQPKVDKNDKKKEQEFTFMKGFYAMVKEVSDLAGQHEVIAENLLTVVLKDMQNNIQETKQERKRLLAEGARLQASLQNQLSLLEKAKAKYERAFREAEKAQELYKKAEQDLHLSKADIEKVKQTMMLKQSLSEDSKAEYAVEVQKTNQAQREHYETHMPQVFQQLQDIDEKRVMKIQAFITFSADIENKVLPIIGQCVQGMTTAATLVDAKQDSQIVIDQFKTGFFPPTDVQFEDLSNGISGSGNVGPKPEVARSTVSSNKNKKRSGIRGIFGNAKVEEPREDFGHLPPNQQKKQLLTKIDTLRANIAKDTSARDALLKMQDVYRQNPQLGDAATLDRQLEDNAQKLDQLRQEVSKYENYLADMDRNSNLDVVSGTTLTPSPCQTRHAIETSSTATEQSRVTSKTPAVTDQDSFDEEDLGDLGTCTALYAFEATTESALSMAEGEKFTIIESDQGDGWMHVRRATGETGFVPTTYVQCQFSD